MHAIITEKVLPPNESFNILVSLLSLNGIWLLSLDNAVITLLNASNPELIDTASLKRSPMAPLFLIRSDPAKSTKFNLNFTVFLLVIFSNISENIACDLDEFAFEIVAAVFLFKDPVHKRLIIFLFTLEHLHYHI